MKEQQQIPLKTLVFKRWSRCKYAVFASLKNYVCIGVLSFACCSILNLNAQSLSNGDISVLSGSSSQDEMEEEASDTIPTTAVWLKEVHVQGEKPLPLPPMVQVLSVLPAQDIKQAGVQNLQDLLRFVPGVDLRSRGGENIQADLSLRGGTFDQSVVLLDGVNITDPQTGHHSLNIPLAFSAIERIEVWQGAGAWNYGVSPFTAALNVIPRAMGSTYLQLKASGGMYGYYQAEGSGQITKNKWSVAADAGYTASDGYTDNTDFKIANALLRISFTDPEKVGIFKFSAGFQSKDFGAQSFYSTKYKEQYENTKAFLAIMQYSKTWNSWRIEAKAYWRQHHDRFDLFRYSSSAPSWYTGPNLHRTDVVGVGAEAAYAWKKGGTTLFGMDYRYEHIYSNNIGELLPMVVKDSSDGIVVPFQNGYFYNRSAERQNGSVFIQHSYKSDNDNWRAAAGILVNGSSDYGAFVFGGLSATYNFNSNYSLEAFVNHSYRLPTFTDLYYKSATQTANPNLKPEQALTAEIAAKWKLNPFSARLGVFYRYGFSIIDWVRLPGEEMWYSRNLTQLQTLGVEASFSYKPSIPYLRRIGFNYNYIYVSKNSGEYLSLYATDYLRNSFCLSVEHYIYKSLGASWEFRLNDRAGSYLDESGKEERYKPYLLCNLKIYWERPKYELFIMASNLFNVPYFDLGNIMQAGIWVKGGVVVKL